MTTQQMVLQFHHTFCIPVAVSPRIPSEERVDLRVDILQEEFDEYLASVEAGSIVETADALADMAYIIFGTAMEYGIDLDAVLEEVHRSNMSKLGPDGKALFREDGKVVKGPNYSRPDITSVLARIK